MVLVFIISLPSADKNCKSDKREDWMGSKHETNFRSWVSSFPLCLLLADDNWSLFFVYSPFYTFSSIRQNCSPSPTPSIERCTRYTLPFLTIQTDIQTVRREFLLWRNKQICFKPTVAITWFLLLLLLYQLPVLMKLPVILSCQSLQPAVN